MKNTELKFNFWKLSYVLLGALIFAILGLWMLSYIFEHYNDINTQSRLLRNKHLNILLSILVVIFFGGGGLAAACVTIRHKTKYIVKDTGIEFYSARNRSFLVKWDEIKYLYEHRNGIMKFIVVEVNDIKQYQQRHSSLVKKIIESNLKLGYPPIMVNLDLIKEKPEEVLAIMNKYWDEWKQKNANEVN